MATFFWTILSTFILFEVQVSVAITQLTSPGGNLCPGDTLTYTCVTYNTGTLVWKINDVSAGDFNSQTDDAGTSLQLISGVTVMLTAKDESLPALSSDLVISSAGVDVSVGDVISCMDHVTAGSSIETSVLSLLSIDVVTGSAQYINFASAKVTVEEFVTGAFTCLKEVIYEAVPTTVGIASTPSLIISGVEAVFNNNLDFCSANYTFKVTPVSTKDVNGTTFTTDSVSGNIDDVVPFSDLLVTPTGLSWLLSRALEFCIYAGAEVSWPPQNSVMVSLSDQNIPQSVLTDAGFSYCVSTNVVISPYLLSLGAVRSKSASTTYVARPLGFSGPSNVRGTPMFTHDNSGIVTGLTIEATWDAVPVETFGPNVALDTANFDCSLTGSSISVTCDSTTSHTFTLANPDNFVDRSFGIFVQVNYEQCTNLSTNLDSDTITSLPVIEGDTGETTEFKVQVNPEVVAEGSTVQIILTPTTNMSASSLSTTATVSNSMLLSQLTGLSPATEYKYTVTFFDVASGKLGRTLHGLFRSAELPQQVNSVFFELQGQMYSNNSEINIADVGERGMALFCRTDKVDCCRTSPNKFGDFFYPSGDRVLTKRRDPNGFYRTRSNSQHIRLHRNPGVNSPTGMYRCEIPDASDVTQIIFINITP